MSLKVFIIIKLGVCFFLRMEHEVVEYDADTLRSFSQRFLLWTQVTTEISSVHSRFGRAALKEGRWIFHLDTFKVYLIVARFPKMT